MPMRNDVLLNQGWTFTYHDGSKQVVDIPHTWNNLDGQDGGNDYWRGTLTYEKTFAAPAFDKETQEVYLEFRGVNASAKVTLNGQVVATHDGGHDVTPNLGLLDFWTSGLYTCCCLLPGHQKPVLSLTPQEPGNLNTSTLRVLLQG